MLLYSHLSAIDDPRRREGRRFELAYLLLFTLLTIISGANSYRAITRFMQARLDWFKALTGVRWPRAPSHTGLRKCLLKLDGNEIEALAHPPTAWYFRTSAQLGAQFSASQRIS